MLNEKVTGYKDLPVYPDYPAQDVPSKADCGRYKFISMKQLCNITDARGLGRSSACNAFGGDNGDKPVQPDRQAWKWNRPGHRVKKFVLVSAVENYFGEIGVDW